LKFLEHEFQSDILNSLVKFTTHVKDNGINATLYLNIVYESSSLPDKLEKFDIQKLSASLEFDTTHGELAALLQLKLAIAVLIDEPIPPMLDVLFKQLQNASLYLKFKSLNDALNHSAAGELVNSLDLEEVVLVLIKNLAQFSTSPFDAYVDALSEMVRAKDNQDVMLGVHLLSTLVKVVETVPRITVTLGKHLLTLKSDIPSLFHQFPEFPPDVVDIVNESFASASLPQ